MLPPVGLAAELRNGESTGGLLAEHWCALVAFVVRFGVISGFWRALHWVFEQVRTSDEHIVHLSFV